MSTPPKPPSDGYERPNCRHRCGRGAVWGTPCSEGPNPDGTCPKSELPCVPRATLRDGRGWITVWASLVTTLLLAAGFHFGSAGPKRSRSADPGPLSTSHAAFTAEVGCAACHETHEGDVDRLLKAIVQPHGFNQACASCHSFAGPADSPHNAAFVSTRGAQSTDCRQCHAEHKGAMADITKMSGEQCQTCHRQTFQRFDLDHPPFPANFPRLARAAIKFDHASHFKGHFLKPGDSFGPTVACATCHGSSPARDDVTTAGFDVACARCHEEQTRQTELTLLRLPDPTTKPAELDAAEATPFMSTRLTGTNPPYGERLRALLGSIVEKGPKELLTASTPTTNTTRLIAGLSHELLATPLKTWLKGDAPGLSPNAPASGWYWFDDLTPELRHRPAGHADPVLRAWLEQTSSEAAPAFKAELRHPQKGPGRCAKCHVLDGPPASTSWTYAPRPAKAQTRFSHGTHLGLRTCIECHALDATVDYNRQFSLPSSPPVSTVHGVTASSCTDCHAEKKVSQDCRLCHRYHTEAVTHLRIPPSKGR